MKAIASVRLTGASVSPSFSVATHVSSRVLRIFCAIRSTAFSQEMSSQWSLPGALYCGFASRFGEVCVANMDMPFTHSDPRFTMWSKSPSMAISLPSRTDAIMPHPHEQKLHDVVNSLTWESFKFSVLARTAGRSIRLLSASPAQPPALLLNHSLRESRDAFGDDSASFRVSRGSNSFPGLRTHACFTHASRGTHSRGSHVPAALMVFAASSVGTPSQLTLAGYDLSR